MKVEVQRLFQETRGLDSKFMKEVIAATRQRITAASNLAQSPALDLDPALGLTDPAAKLLDTTNTPEAKQLKSAWGELITWKDIPATTHTSFLNIFTGFSCEVLGEPDAQAIMTTSNKVASMVVIQSMYRPLKPRESREHLLNATQATWLSGASSSDSVTPVTLPPPLCMLFQKAVAAHQVDSGAPEAE